jgi:hypothetical protein
MLRVGRTVSALKRAGFHAEAKELQRVARTGEAPSKRLTDAFVKVKRNRLGGGDLARERHIGR